jgi:hypothetical protein
MFVQVVCLVSRQNLIRTQKGLILNLVANFAGILGQEGLFGGTSVGADCCKGEEDNGADENNSWRGPGCRCGQAWSDGRLQDRTGGCSLNADATAIERR